jgi:hypothetical protein
MAGTRLYMRDKAVCLGKNFSLQVVAQNLTGVEPRQQPQRLPRACKRLFCKFRNQAQPNASSCKAMRRRITSPTLSERHAPSEPS